MISRLLRISIVAVLTGVSGLVTAKPQSEPLAERDGAAVSANAEAGATEARVELPGNARLRVGARGIALLDADGRERVLSSEAHTAASATMLASGRVLIWGGTDASGKPATNYWFDPLTRVLESAANVPLEARSGHTVSVLTDGRVLMAGGRGPYGNLAHDAALWNPAQGGESTAVPMTSIHWQADAELNADGSISVSAGRGQGSSVAETFDAQRERFASGVAKAEPSRADAAIAGSIPLDHATGVAPDALLAVRFSRLLAEQTLNARNVTLLGPNGPAEIRVIAAEHGRLLFVRPERDLLPASSYSLFVSGASDANGAAVPLLTLTFETGRKTAGGTLAAADEPLPASTPAAPAGLSKSSSAANTATPVALHLEAGAAALQASAAHEACDSHDQIHGYRFCHAEGSIAGGVFTPGFNNTRGRWRLNKPEPALLKASDLPEGTLPVNATSVFGTIRRIDDVPVANVTVSLGTRSAKTDAQGRFVLSGVPEGHQVLLVDGASANHDDVEFGEFLAAVDLKAGSANAMPYTMYLPRITARDKVHIPSPTTVDTVITHTSVPGLEIRIPAGTVVRDRNGKVVTEFALVPMPVDRSPIPVPANFPVYFSTQPGAGTVEGLTAAAAGGLQVIYPNYTDNNSAGQGLWYYDAQRSGWKIYTTTDLSKDEKTFVPRGQFAGLHLMPKGGPSAGGPGGAKGCACESSDGDFDFGNGSNNWEADPVDTGTGVFIHNMTDLRMNDVLPAAVSRGYNSSDTLTRAFGLGMSHTYGMYLTDPNSTCEDTVGTTAFTLVDGDGIQYPFHLVAGSGAGADSPNGYLIHTSTPSKYYGATLRVNWGHGDLQSFIDLTLKDGTVYGFNVGCPTTLAYVRDRFGNTTNLSYSAGLLRLVALPSGRFFSYGYNSNNLISQVSDNTGRTVSYGYDTSKRLQTVTYPDGTTVQYTYTASGQMQTVQDRRGTIRVTNTYDSNGRVHIQQSPDGTHQFDYTLNGSKVASTQITDALGHVELLQFDAAGYPLSKTRAYGTPIAQTVTFTRGQDELITSKTDARGRVTKRTYDAFGDVLTLTYPYGLPSAVTYTYTYTSDFHQIATIKDPLAHTTTFSYTNGCLTSIKDALNHTTTITCNGSGQPLTIKDALNHTSTLTYAGSDLSTISDALSHTSYLTTDAHGQVIAIQDPMTRRTLLSYDSNGRVIQSVDALGQATINSYDGNGNLKSVTDPNGGKTQYGYDPMDRLNARTDAMNQTESWAYDSVGNLKTYTDRKHQLTQYQYDALNRPSLVTYADGSTVTPTFDTGNRLTNIADTASGTIVRSYDDLDRLTQEQSPQGAVSYTYDAASRRATMTPGNQAQITYTFDNANRLTNIVQGTETVTIGYDNANRRTSLTLPNGIVTSYGYDNADELTSISYKNSGGTTLGTLTYGYDAAGQRLSRVGGFGTDLLPTPSAGPNTFDLANKQTVWNGLNINYDLNGDPSSNASTSPATTYTFDVRHRLTQIQQGTTTIASFVYDTFGRRINKTINGVTTAYLFDGENPVQESQGPALASTVLTGLGIDERFARDDAAYGRAYFLTDALGSTVGLSDSAQSIRQAYSYEPYGESTASGTSDNPYQYTGRENDATGLYYYRARYYSPGLRRFISEDPIGLLSGSNSYAYANLAPTYELDPLGLWSLKFSLYWGRGASVTLGNDGGKWFFRFGAGVGVGGGLKFYPDGSFPKSPTEGCGCGPRAFIGASGSFGGSIGPLGAEVKGQAGVVVTKDCEGHPHMSYIEEIKPDWSLKGKSGYGVGVGGGINLVDIGLSQ